MSDRFRQFHSTMRRRVDWKGVEVKEFDRFIRNEETPKRAAARVSKKRPLQKAAATSCRRQNMFQLRQDVWIPVR
jgi:hypothetical protein